MGSCKSGGKGNSSAQATERYSNISPKDLKSGDVINPKTEQRWTYIDNNQGSFILHDHIQFVVDNVKSTKKTTTVTGYSIVDLGKTVYSRYMKRTYKNDDYIKKTNGVVTTTKGAGKKPLTLDYAKSIRIVK